MENNLHYSVVDVLPTNEQLIKFAVFTDQNDFSWLKNGRDNESEKLFADYVERCIAYNIDFEDLLNSLCLAKALEVSSDIDLTKEQREECQTKLSDFFKWYTKYLAKTDSSESADNKDVDNV